MAAKFKGKYRIESTRHPTWDYSWNGIYFVTININDRTFYFGNVVNKEMEYSKIGEIAIKYWEEIPRHFEFVKLDAFQIMPDHMHGIIIIDGGGDARLGRLCTTEMETWHLGCHH